MQIGGLSDDEKKEKKVQEPVTKEETNKAFNTLRMFLLKNKKDCGSLIQRLEGIQE